MSLFNLITHSHNTFSPPAAPLDRQRDGMAARVPSEQELARLWAEVLELEHVGPDDDFFALGGDSLLALELFAKIEKLCGKKLPLSTLMQAKTLREFAKVFGSEKASPLWPSLVMVQPGSARPPLFCVHAIGGNILGYFDLARYLGPEQPMYALRARGLDGIQEPHGSVEDMARDYLQEVRQVQPRGPYFICGHSFGGLVAFEMARQLQAQGQRTALLAVFDSRKPPSPPSALAYGGQLLAGLQLGVLARKGWHRLARSAWRLKIWTAQTAYKLMGKPLPRDLAHIRATDYCAQAGRRYAPQVYAGRLTFFRAMPSSVTAAAAKIQIKWNELAAGGVENHVVPCEHQTMLNEPHVQLLAAQLKVCLRKAQELSREGPDWTSTSKSQSLTRTRREPTAGLSSHPDATARRAYCQGQQTD